MTQLNFPVIPTTQLTDNPDLWSIIGGDMLQVFKMVKGINRVNPSTFFSMNTQSITRGQDQTFMKKHAGLGVHQSVFSQSSKRLEFAHCHCLKLSIAHL